MHHNDSTAAQAFVSSNWRKLQDLDDESIIRLVTPYGVCHYEAEEIIDTARETWADTQPVARRLAMEVDMYHITAIQEGDSSSGYERTLPKDRLVELFPLLAVLLPGNDDDFILDFKMGLMRISIHSVNGQRLA